MSDWKLVQAYGCHNWVLNPSAETTGNFGNNGATGIAVTRTLATSFRGNYAYQVATAAEANSGMYMSLYPLTNAVHYLTYWIYGAHGTIYAAFYNGDGLIDTVTPAQLNAEGNWYQFGVQVPAATAFKTTGANKVYLVQTEAQAKTFYIDCIQVETHTTWTTYCDGDQDGGVWSGTPHASYSTRDGRFRDGGLVKDLVTDYGLAAVQAVMGYSGPTKESMLDPLAFVDGSVYQGTRAAGRVLQLECKIKGTTLADYYSKRKAFLSAINRHAYEQQPTIFYYTGAGKTAAIRAFVESGDEGGRIEAHFEKFTLNLMAVEDPYWEELREQSAWLAASATLAQKAAMKLSGASSPSTLIPSQDIEWDATTGPWSTLGITALGGNHTIHTMTKDDAGNFYVGGDFTNLNDIAEADYVAKRSPDGTWSAMAGGAGSAVYALCPETESGYVLVGGAFDSVLDAGGTAVPNTKGVSEWQGTAWHQIPYGGFFGGGASDAVYSITRAGTAGGYYVGGAFGYVDDSNGNLVADSSGIVRWSGLNWYPVGAGLGTAVFCTAVDSASNLFVGGSFQDAGSVSAADYLAKWNGTAWSSVGVFNGNVLGMAFAPNGTLYAVGDFTTIDGETRNRVASYNGQKWAALGTGLNDTGRSVVVMPSGLVYVAGDFTTAGGVTVDKVAVWNGTSWAPLDVTMPASTTVYALAADSEDLYIGIDKATDATVSGTNDSAVDVNGWITCLGTAPCAPIIQVSSSTAGTIYAVRNYTTGQEILLSVPVVANEVITIDTRPGRESVRSNYPWGVGRNITPAMPTDLGGFRLLPGANLVTACGAVGAGGTMLFKMRWRIKHDGAEGAAA